MDFASVDAVRLNVGRRVSCNVTLRLFDAPIEKRGKVASNLIPSLRRSWVDSVFRPVSADKVLDLLGCDFMHCWIVGVALESIQRIQVLSQAVVALVAALSVRNRATASASGTTALGSR